MITGARAESARRLHSLARVGQWVENELGNEWA